MIDTLNFIGYGLIACGLFVLYTITWAFLVKLCSRCVVDGDLVEAGVFISFLMFFTGWGFLNISSVI